MPFDADLPAEFEHWAFRTSRQRARTNVFAERDEQTIDLHPVRSRELAFERNGSPFRRARPDVSPTIGHAMHVYIDAYARLTAGDSQRQIGAFRSDALKRQQRVGLAWRFAFIFLNDAPRDHAYLPRLALVKRAGAYQPIDLARSEPADFERGSRPFE